MRAKESEANNRGKKKRERAIEDKVKQTEETEKIKTHASIVNLHPVSGRRLFYVHQQEFSKQMSRTRRTLVCP